MAVRITCINKAWGDHENPYTAISHLGWTNEASGETRKSTRLEMYEWIKSGGHAYVKDAWGNTTNLITAETAYGTKYVKTVANNTESDNLLRLPECQ